MWEKKSFWLILLGVLCVVIVGLIVGILLSSELLKSTENDGEDISFIDEYMSELNEAVEKAGTKEYKEELYTNCAGSLYDYQLQNGGEYSDMIFDCAYKAEAINPTAFTAYNLYVYEKELGDEAKADKYLEKAKERGIDDVEIAV